MFKELPLTREALTMRGFLVSGVGTNDAPYIVQPTINGKLCICPYYSIWRAMLTRCYCEKAIKRRPTYKNYTVVKEWLTFSNFKAWMEVQDWEGKNLDKNSVTIHATEYSPDTCAFVSYRVNSLLTNLTKKAGVYKDRNKFRAICSVNSKRKHIGTYATKEEATTAYRNFKARVLINTANIQDDPRVYFGLLKHALFLTNPKELASI